MSTTWIIGIIIAAVVVIGGGYYAVHSGSMSMGTYTGPVAAGDVTGDGMAQGAQPDNGGATFTGSWNDLVARGGNYKCDINSAGAKNSTTGVVYVSGMNVRGDFQSQTSAGAMTSSMLKSGDTIYVWGSAMKQGVMMKATAMTGQGGTATQGGGVSQGQSYSWDCTPSTGSASLFVKPTNIDFIDVAAMMQGGATGGIKY